MLLFSKLQNCNSNDFIYFLSLLSHSIITDAISFIIFKNSQLKFRFVSGISHFIFTFRYILHFSMNNHENL